MLDQINRASSILWISETSSDERWNLSTSVHHYAIAAKLVQKLVLDNVPGATSNLTLSDGDTINTTISDNTRSYLEVLSSTSSHFDIDDSPPSPSTQPKQITFSTDTNTSYISSLETSAKKQSVEIENMKEHISRSITSIRKEFEQFKTTIRKEVKATVTELLQTQNDKLETATDLMNATSTRMDDTSSRISKEMKELRSQMSEEIQQLREAILLLPDRPPKPAKRHKLNDPLTQDSSTVATHVTDTTDMTDAMTIEEPMTSQLP